MDLSQFLDAYTKSGHALLEAKSYIDQNNVNQWLGMFAPLQGGAIPAPTGPVEPGQSITDALATPGTPVKSQAPPKQDKTQQPASVRYAPMEGGRGAQPTPQSGVFDFIEGEWNMLVSAYDANPQAAAAQATTDGVPTDEDAQNPDPQTAAQQEAADDAARVQASDELYADIEASTPEGYPDEGAYPPLKRLVRQMLGFGGVGKLTSAVTQGMTLEEKLETAKEVVSSAKKILSIGDKLDKGMPLDAADKEFMEKCIRMRGSTDKTHGVYLLGGDECGGDLAAAGARITKRGHIYGVKIGTSKSPLFKIMNDVHTRGTNGEKDYQDSEGKSLPFWGGGDTARAASYRALMGVLNEFGPGMAQAWVKCGRQQPCEQLNKEIKGMIDANKNNLDVKLLLWGAQQMHAGKIKEEDMEFAGLEVEGTVKMLGQMKEELGEVPDAATAMAWTIGKLLNQWDAIVTHPAFDGCEWEVVGRGPTGNRPDGSRINQDVQLKACSGKSSDGILNSIRANSKFDVRRDRGHHSGDENTLGASMKVTDGGTTIDTGKASTSKIDGIPKENEPAAQASRERHADYIRQVAKKNKFPLPEDFKEKADAYREKEKDAISTFIGAVLVDGEGTGVVLQDKLSSMGYEEGAEWNAMMKLAKKAGKGDEAAIRELRVKVTNGYRNAHKSDPGMRYNMAIEAGVTGMSTQAQGMIVGDGQTGDTYMGLESDVTGQAICAIIGIGRDKPLDMHVTQTGVNFKDEEGNTLCSLNRRMKEGSANSFFTVGAKWAKDQMTNLGQGGPGEGEASRTESRMEAEDFVRLFQELIQGVNKVLPVQN